jgi:hypothetical protein
MGQFGVFDADRAACGDYREGRSALVAKWFEQIADKIDIDEPMHLEPRHGHDRRPRYVQPGTPIIGANFGLSPRSNAS